MEMVKNQRINGINNEGWDDVEVKEVGSNLLLVIASKKIIIPDSRIVVDKYTSASLSKYQTVIGNEYEKTASGIFLAK